MPLTPPPSAPPAAPAAPGDAPSRANPSSFRALADAFVVWQMGFRSSLADLRTWLASFISWAGTHVNEMDVLQADVTTKSATATTQAEIATTKASEASASAEAAADAEAATLGYLQAYRATSYGALAADPTTDPNGNPCTVGDEYFNTTISALKRFNGITWYIPDLDAADLATSNGAGQVGIGQQTLAAAIPLNLARSGGVADYAGTAVYDGADSGRITATDNTTAFNALITAALAAGKNAVRIPAGHWGIKTGNLSFSNFDKLRIYGDGIGQTILDFIKEDTSHTGGAYVDHATANAIASFTTGNAIEFQDLTLKATTKGGLVNGAAGSGRVYEGAVWAFKINNVAEVRCTRVRVEHFNYRGFSIYGTATQRVVLTHCEGFYNAGSGFWVEDAAVVRVNGGEFAYNGIFGEIGTGYGVTANENVGKFTTKDAHFHHNYRKGLDSHGTAEFKALNCTFQENVLFHLAVPNVAPPAGIVDCSVIIKGNTFSNGKLPVDRAWLKTCYDQLATNGYATDLRAQGCIVGVLDQSDAGVPLDRIKTVVFEDNDVLCHYNGVADTAMQRTAPLLYILAQVGEIVFKNNRINLEHAAFYAGSDVYSHLAFQLKAQTLRVVGNDIKFTATTSYTNVTNATADRGVLFELINSGAKTLEMHGNRFELGDVYLTASTAVGLRSPVAWTVAGSRRIAKDNVFSWTGDPYRGTQGINDAYFLGTAAANNVILQQGGNVFIRNGVMYRMPEGQVDRTSDSLSWKLLGVVKASGSNVLTIVLDKQYASTIRVSTNDGSPDLLITNAFSSYAAVTGSTSNSTLQLASVNAVLAENGLTKLALTLSCKLDLSGNYWGRVTVDGALPSLGIERIVEL